MTRKLDQADRAAVDLILDRTNAVGNDFVSMTGVVAEERVSAVQKVLSVLSTMQAPEPPADLVTRTLQRAARMGGPAATMPAGMQPFIDPTQPLA